MVGQIKTEIFKNAHICYFPTYHGEGLATTICESMAFGLPVVTRPMGGVAAFFVDREHGFPTTSKEPEVIAELIEKLLDDRELYKYISRNNYNFAQEKFLASSAVMRLEKIYESALKTKSFSKMNYFEILPSAGAWRQIIQFAEKRNQTI